MTAVAATSQQHLVRPRDRIGHVGELEHLRTARLGDDHCAHRLTVAPAGPVRRTSGCWPATRRTGRVGGMTAASVSASARSPRPRSWRWRAHGAGVELTAGRARPPSPRPGRSSSALADDVEPHYGISTGFGALATKHIPPEQRAQLQRSLIRSHAAGCGPEVEREVVRALMLLRLSTLATGRTGVRPETAAALAGLLDAGITPVVPRVRLARLLRRPRPAGARRAGAASARGTVRDPTGRCGPAAEALAAAGIAPVGWPRRRAWR